ncbi:MULTISPECIES: hypothetical protein [unclassified Streptomyces]|uniref:hypothetical protein n=1 Tax=unclassified Streptomyces TaxID=2593676 RepID=UPI0033BDA3B8
MAAGALVCGLMGAAPAQAQEVPTGKFQIRPARPGPQEDDRCVGWGDKQGRLWPVENRACSESRRTTWRYETDTRMLVSTGDCLEAWETHPGNYSPIVVTCEAVKAAQKWTLMPHYDVWGNLKGYSINPEIRMDHDLFWTTRHGGGLDIRLEGALFELRAV